MKKNNLINVLFLSFLLLSISSCLNNEEYSPEEIQQLIQNEVDKRVEEYVSIRNLNVKRACWRKLPVY